MSASTLVRALAAGAMLAAMVASGASAQTVAPAGLFGPTVGPSALSIQVDRAAIRARAVRPDLRAVDELARSHLATSAASRFTLDLFPGLDLDAEVIAAEVRTTGTTVFSKLVGIELGTAILTHEAGVLLATINFPGGNYMVERVAGGDYRVVQWAAHLVPREAPPSLYFSPAPAADAFAEPDVPADSGRLIDVMIVWTPEAEAAAGNAAAMQILAQASVDNANMTYLNSGVAQRLRLVHRQQVTYTEVATCVGRTDAFDCARDAITNGDVPGLHALRDQHGADLVSLFINSTGFCGTAWIPYPPSAATATLGYSVVQWRHHCLADMAFVHELGHNMGAAHDPYVASRPGAYAYSHGMVNLVAPRWRTVMAYDAQCTATPPNTPCGTVNYLSNPRLTFGGTPMGDATARNNAHTLNKTAKVIAAYRPTSALHPVPQRFTDVAAGHPFYGHIEFLAQAGVTGGCATGLYCPDTAVTRRQMAVFIERTLRASNWTPPAATGLFTDVPAGAQFRDYVEALRNDAITSGCTTTAYCPDDPVTRAQMAVFVLRAMCGAAYVPIPPRVQRFTDVAPSHAFYPFIDKMAELGITSGCGGGNYCPDSAVTRSQMAVFLERSFPLKVPTEACPNSLDFTIWPSELFEGGGYELRPVFSYPPGPYDCTWSSTVWGPSTLVQPNCVSGSLGPWGGGLGPAGTTMISLTLSLSSTGQVIDSVTRPVVTHHAPGFDPGTPDYNYQCVDRLWVDANGYHNHHFVVDITATAYLPMGGSAVGMSTANITSCGGWRVGVQDGKTVCHRDAGLPVSTTMRVHDEQRFFSGQLVTSVMFNQWQRHIYQDGVTNRCTVIPPP